MQEIVIEEVKKIRETAPGIGSSTLYPLLQNIFGKENMLGRDHFYALMKERGLQLKRRRSHRTTNSYHRFHKWKNLIKELVLTGPNQLWVSDITYIKLSGGGVSFLHLITDAYSRKVLGWKVANSLEARHTLEAFDMAATDAAKSNVDFTKVIHHSDRGVQYCCNMYVNRLLSLGMKISMTEEYKPTDNCIAERVNGVLKQLFIEGQTLSELSDVYFVLSKGIPFYNDVRPHSSIGYATPSAVHRGEVKNPQRKWKSRRRSEKSSFGMTDCTPSSGGELTNISPAF
jgi:transposase InsO family protein